MIGLKLGTKTAIQAAEEIIFTLGASLCAEMANVLTSVDIGQLREFFYHNEYGEAMNLLAHVLDEDEIHMSAAASDLQGRIVEQMNLVQSLYGSCDHNNAAQARE